MAVDPSQLRVLVVDDDEELLELLGEYLRVRGLQVQTSTDGELAREIVRGGRLDVVLTDHHPPRVDAFVILAEARRVERPVSVLLMTRHPQVESCVAAFKGGAADYLIKPFKLKDTYDALMAAAAKLDERRLVHRGEELREFLEVSLGMEDEAQIPRLVQLFLAVTRRETESAEAAVWVSRGGALARVGHVGQGGILLALNPDEFYEPRQGAAGLAAVPLRHGRQRVGVVAVAGGSPRTAAHLDRVRVLGRAFCAALARLAGGEVRTLRP